MGVQIILNEAEQVLARHLAKARYHNARNQGIADLKMGNQSNEFTDLEGISAEIAVAKFLKVYPDTEIANQGEMPPYDLLSRTGVTIDVKTTKYRNGKLLVTLKKNPNDCQRYILCVGEFPIYTIVGYADSEQIFREENIADLGHGKGYVLSQEKLRRL